MPAARISPISSRRSAGVMKSGSNIFVRFAGVRTEETRVFRREWDTGPVDLIGSQEQAIVGTSDGREGDSALHENQPQAAGSRRSMQTARRSRSRSQPAR